MSRKGSLSLSITAIVVIVIAFVVLGLGLGLTKKIFGGAEDILPTAFDLTQLEAEPTSENPITLKGDISIGRQKSETMGIGFYNKGQNTAPGATFDIIGCLDVDGKTVTTNIPTLASPSEDVGASSAVGYKIILNEKGMPAGKYICTVGVKCAASDCSTVTSWTKEIGGKRFYETKQFFLTVVA